MTTVTFTPVKAPDQGAQVQKKPRVLSTQLGDGYVQRTPDGINTILRKMTLSWTNLYKADAATIDTFFTQQNGNLPFWWTPNGESTPRVFICESWEFKELSGGFATLSNCIFVEAAPT
jgi:phage-related protein